MKKHRNFQLFFYPGRIQSTTVVQKRKNTTLFISVIQVVMCYSQS